MIDISPVKHLRLTFDNTLDKLEKIVDYVIIYVLKLISDFFHKTNAKHFKGPVQSVISNS